MSYIGSALRRGDRGWSGVDLDLAEVDDFDTLTDVVRDGVDSALLLLEEDDEYVGIVRVEGDADARVFLSDRRVLDADGLAARLFGESLEQDAVVAEATDEEDDEEESGRPEVEPVGDQDLLADLGVSGETLVRLCAEEGMLPSDVIFAVGEAIGAADELERVRGV